MSNNIYQPTYESVSQHPIPDWYHNAKLGIFIHWGLYSVPAWAYTAEGFDLGEIIASGNWEHWFAHNAYAEWYMNTYQLDGPTKERHAEVYGTDFDYAQFAPMFNEAIQQWNPNEWASLFKQANARYVVLTTKHHDGFLLWPSDHPNPYIENYHASRDILGELANAVRAQDMRMAYYYSGGIDWTFHPQVVTDVNTIRQATPQMDEYVDYANAHWREIIAKYQTEILWNDIAYPRNTDLNVLFAEYYNEFPEGLINNRFTQNFQIEEGRIISDVHFDYETPEYTTFDEIREKKWEACRGIGSSFGYNQAEGPEHYLSVTELVRSFVDMVSKNGNLLLNVGPMADGTIPELQRERLLGLGRWLDVNGEAIFDTRPWVTAEGGTTNGTDIRYTKNGDAVYATLMGTPDAAEIAIEGLQAAEGTTISLIGHDSPLSWSQDGHSVKVSLPELDDAPAHSLKITPAPKSLAE